MMPLIIAIAIVTIICCVLATMVFLTNRKLIAMENAKEEVEKVSATKSAFLTKLSHEIRTPLNAIKGFAELTMDTSSISVANDNAKEIMKAADVLLEAIKSVSDISKIESGDVNFSETGAVSPDAPDVPIFSAVSLTGIISDYTGRKVLIVDDNKTNINIAKKLLENYNLQITECLTGQEVIDIVGAGERFDLLLIDDMMPEMSGTQLLDRLKSVGYQVPMVVLTANAMTGEKEKYLEKGFADYLGKPINRDELDTILSKYL